VSGPGEGDGRQTRLDVPRGSPVRLHAVPDEAGQAVEVRPQGLHLLFLHEEYFKHRIVKRAKEKIEEAMEEGRLESEVGT